MPEAKITLVTEAKNESLEKLQRALAAGEQNVDALKRQLKDLKKATKDGADANDEQRASMERLRKQIRVQTDENKALGREIKIVTARIKDNVNAMTTGDKGARALAGAFKLTEGFTTAFSVALGNLAANIAGAAVSAVAEMASQVATLGAQMQQSVAHMAAMTGSVETATEAQRALNDVYRNTNFQEEAVMNMGTQLMRMGYSAENAAGLIQLCADAATGLGTGQQGAQQLVDAISRMQAVGELTSRQMQQLALSGVNMDAAFKSLGMTGEQAMKAVENGTLDTQQAIGALTDYLHQYDGKMAESKNNTIDAWGDVTGNLQTMCAEIGNSIFDAFNQSEIVQVLIDFTQSLVDMVRSDATGAFSDLKAIASEVLNFIGGLLGAVLDTVKLIIIVLHDAYAAFKSFGQQVVDAIRPAVDVVMALYDAVKAVMSSIGKNFASEVSSSWSATFGSNLEPEERAERSMMARTNNFTPRTYSGGSSGGGSRGGGGGSSGTDTARAEAEAKKKAEAEAKAAREAYEKEFNDIFKAMQEDSKTLLDGFLGDPESAAEKVKKIKEQLAKDLEEIDKATAMSENEGSINPLAAVLGKDPEILQAELDARGQSIADFVEDVKQKMTELAETEAKSVNTADAWKKRIQQYAEDVGKSLGNAMADFILGEKTASEALKKFVEDLIKNAVRMLAQWVGVYLTVLAFGLGPKQAALSANKIALGIDPKGKAMGGLITGPGTGTSDSIPTMLSNGEYVIRSAAVDRIGVGTLDAINSGRVSSLADADGAGAEVMGGSSVTLNISTVDAASFRDFLSRDGLAEIKQAFFSNNREFGSEVGVW